MAGGLITVRPSHECTRLVGHQQERLAACEFERGNDAGHPVNGLLAGCGTGAGVVVGAQHRDEHLGLDDLPRAGVPVWRRLAGVVHKELVACFIGMALYL